MTHSASGLPPETALYAPIRDFLEAQGYAVRGEVMDCDIAATRGDDLILVELKRRFSLELLIQAARRQRVGDSVYVAVPGPVPMPWKRWRDCQHLLRRLELGLIVVDFSAEPPEVEVLFHPVPFARRRTAARRRAVLRELKGRSGDFNTGGSTRAKVMTAYRESAVHIAFLLDLLGPQTARALRAHGTGPKTHAILYYNVYGWFERIDRGVYTLAAAGRDALAEYAAVVEGFAAEWTAPKAG